jgi:hypothetical protein
VVQENGDADVALLVSAEFVGAADEGKVFLANVVHDGLLGDFDERKLLSGSGLIDQELCR